MSGQLPKRIWRAVAKRAGHKSWAFRRVEYFVASPAVVAWLLVDTLE